MIDVGDVAAKCADLRQGDFLQKPCGVLVQSELTEDPASLTVPVEGLVIISQTCDLVTPPENDPYIQVARLISVEDPKERSWLESGHVPQVVPIPAAEGLFADLGIVVTFDKAAIAGESWARTIESPDDADAFGNGVGRKSSRFAFPDDFQAATKKLRDRIRNKYGKMDSPEGRVLTRVRQIRVTASPGWWSNEISATLTFIVDPAEFPIGNDVDDTALAAVAAEFDGKSIAQLCAVIEDPEQAFRRPAAWDTIANAWTALAVPTGTVIEVDAEVEPADQFSALDMWATQRLDMDYLSDEEDPHPPEP